MTRKTTATPSQPAHFPTFTRRRVVGLLAVATVVSTSPALAQPLRRTRAQTEGPFYPDILPSDIDNDLLRIGGRAGTAAGQVTHLRGRILDIHGQPLADTLVEIWQVDANGVYLHSADTHAKRDAGFQGYGRFVTGASGEYAFRTIKPVPYPGRTPHIHFKISPRDRAPFTTQCYVEGEPLNARDGVLNSIRDPRDRGALIVPFVPVSSSEASLSAWFDIVLG